MLKIYTNEKGAFDQLIGPALMIIVFVLVLAVGSIILSNFKTGVSDANATAIIDNGLDGISTMAGQTTTIVWILLGVVFLGLIFMIVRNVKQ